MSPIPWFKVDDKLHDHRKARRARKAAMGVWVLAGSWCMDHLTDGFVPESVLGRWGTKHDAKSLVVSELWEPSFKDGESGWQFRNWDDFQPSKAEIEAEREATKKRVADWRNKRRNGVTNPVTNEGVTPEVQAPRPDPTRPDPIKTFLSEVADATPDAEPRRLDVERLCSRLADRVEANGARRPTITKAWRDSARLLVDRDKRTEEQVAWLIDWSQNDPFWKANILSMPKFREKFDQLLLKARPNGFTPPADDQGRILLPPLPGNEWSGR